VQLISIKLYRQRHFAPGSAPHENTIRRLIREQQLPGRRLGRMYYVDESAPVSKVDALIARVMGHVRRSP
jgi:hypothetical protein